jgi:hypothetical protein
MKGPKGTIADLLLCETRAQASHISDVPLHDADVREMFTAERLQLFTLPLPLLLGVHEALVTDDKAISTSTRD